MLRQQIGKLNTKIALLDEELATYRKIESLKEIGKLFHVNYIPARVIARDPTNWDRSFIINKGRSDGLRANMGVISSGGAVGRIIKLTGHYSKILLISDRNSSVGAMVKRTGIEGIITGDSKGNLIIKYVRIDADVQAGDLVVTSGTDMVFPPGIPIGKVIQVKDEEDSLFKSIWVVPSVELSNVREVLVLRLPIPRELKKLLQEE